jgi:DNA-binding response OmpR family regulator
MPRRIVVIDDAVAIVDLYDEILSDAGYEVVGKFASPPATADPIAAAKPDLVIMDWFFGQEPAGVDLLEMLKSSPSTAATPVIICTAARNALVDGAGDLIQGDVPVVYKPFRIDNLLAVIEQIFV